jgi:cytochrome c peroxidase
MSLPLSSMIGSFLYLLTGVLLLTTTSVSAIEPILPIPRSVDYDQSKALLGKSLFTDPRLSRDGTISCHSCHSFNAGGADPRPVSTGVYKRQGALNSPTVFNSYFNFRQFWNGRAPDLIEQAKGPLHSTLEMDMSPVRIEKFLNSDKPYKRLFKEVYATEQINFDNVVDAIAEFEKALFTPDCKFDRYLRGETELSEDEKSGYILFKSLGCISCHNGINVGGNSYQYLGAVNPVDKDLVGDRFEISNDPFDKNRFKVPGLRNIELTAPYLHDGSEKDLTEVLDIMAFHNLGFKLTRSENRLLQSFLKTLTGKKPQILQE